MLYNAILLVSRECRESRLKDSEFLVVMSLEFFRYISVIQTVSILR